MLSFYLVMVMSGTMWVKDLTNGTFDRSKVHKVSKYQFFIAHLLVMCMLGIFSTLTMLLVIIPTFHIPFNSVLVNVTLLLLLQSTYAITIGFLIGVTCTTDFEFILKVDFIVMPPLMFSENIWSSNSNSFLSKTCSTLNLFRKPTTSFRSLIFSHLSLTDFKVYDGFLHCITFSLLSILLSFIYIRIKN